MLEKFQTSSILAVSVVAIAAIILIYFAVKTLITSNLFQKGVTLYREKDYPGAEAKFRQVIAINSTNDVVRLLLGDVLMQLGNLDEAAEMFNYVISRSPKNADAYLNLSNVRMQQNQPEAAKNNLQQAKDLLQKQRQPEKAEKIGKLLDKMTAKSNQL